MVLIKNASDSEAVEDSPIVKSLKELDDDYMSIEKEYMDEVDKIEAEYHSKLQAILEKRQAKLVDEDGMPKLNQFWLKAIRKYPEFQESIQPYDEEPLSYLQDINKEFLDSAKPSSGFKLNFRFGKNPFFTNEVLTKEYHMGEVAPFTGDRSLAKTVSTEVDWKQGQDVTVSVKKRPSKKKGGNTKIEEPRPSFFRDFMRSLYEGSPILEDMAQAFDAPMDEENLKEMCCYFLEQDHETAQALVNYVIPYATRWYTGEAAPDDEDDDEDSEEEDSDADSESESESSPKRTKGGKKVRDGKPAEECKQQ